MAVEKGVFEQQASSHAQQYVGVSSRIRQLAAGHQGFTHVEGRLGGSDWVCTNGGQKLGDPIDELVADGTKVFFRHHEGSNTAPQFFDTLSKRHSVTVILQTDRSPVFFRHSPS